MSDRPRHLPVVQSDERYEENYAARKAIADKGRAEIEAAIAACGPGHGGYAKWIITDTAGVEPPRTVYCCWDEGGGGWKPKAFERGADEPPERWPDEARAIVVKGVKFYPLRYSVSFSAFSEYSPQTPAQMKAAAESRRAKAIAKQEAEDRAAEEARANAPQLALRFDEEG